MGTELAFRGFPIDTALLGNAEEITLHFETELAEKTEISAHARSRGAACNVVREPLSEGQRQLSSILNSLPGAIYRCSANTPWEMSFMSEGVEALTGFVAEDITSGKVRFCDLIFAEDFPRVQEKLASAAPDRRRLQLTYRLCTPQGARWVREHSTTFFDDQGEPLFREAFIGDIHEEIVAALTLRETEERYKLAARATGDVIWDWDLVSDQVTWNKALANSLGYDTAQLGTTAQWWKERVHPDDRRRVLAEIERAIATPDYPFTTEYRFRRADGSYADMLDRGYVLRDDQGRGIRMVGAMQDMSRRNVTEAALRHSEALNQSILEASADCIKIVGTDGSLQLMNGPGLCAFDVANFEILRGKQWVELWPQPMQSTVRAALEEARKRGAARFTGFCPTALGTPKWWDVVVTPMLTELGEVQQFLSISRDVTANRKSADDLRWASEHDALTGLPNRRSFEAHLQGATIRAMETGETVGLLLLDLDHFKHVNDTLGHAAGDHLLKVFGQRLRSSLRPDDFLARLGGDEFAVILRGISGEEELLRTGESVLSRLQGPVRFDGRVMGASASIGGALFPRDADTARDLFKNADTALYALKEVGRGGTKMFHNYMREQSQRVALQLRLARSVIQNKSIVPFYQPKVDLRTGRVVGYEALLRWHHHNKGMQMPDTLAEAFKDYELASKIGESMQLSVFRDIRQWRENSLEFGCISVNAAPSEFLRDDYAERLISRLQHENVPANLIEVEVTEHVFLDRGTEYVTRALKLLHDAGVRISLDDFGTGYSSLSHLREFPVDVVKIDRSFVSKVQDEPEMAAIVTAVIDLAASLSIDVVAEGVEIAAQDAFLRNAGCRYGQGYYYSHPAKADEVPHLFTRERLLDRQVPIQ